MRRDQVALAVCAAVIAMAGEAHPGATPTATPVVSREKIVARVLFLPTGGVTELIPKESEDVSTREYLRAHASVLEEQMRQGNFALLFTMVKPDPVFVDWMKTNQGEVKTRVTATTFGFRIEFIASKTSAVPALHEFLRRVRGNEPIQINEERPKGPGRELGRDANLKVRPK